MNTTSPETHKPVLHIPGIAQRALMRLPRERAPFMEPMHHRSQRVHTNRMQVTHTVPENIEVTVPATATATAASRTTFPNIRKRSRLCCWGFGWLYTSSAIRYRGCCWIFGYSVYED
jgi:hypothetical protein